MKILNILLKLMTFGIVLLVSGIIFMFTTASYLPRLNGANYYDHGCFNGVTNFLMELQNEKGWPEKYRKLEENARKNCKKNVEKLNKKGYLF